MLHTLKILVSFSTAFILSCASFLQIKGTLEVEGKVYRLSPEETKRLSKIFGRKWVKTIGVSDILGYMLEESAKENPAYLILALPFLLSLRGEEEIKCILTFKVDSRYEKDTYRLCVREENWVLLFNGEEHRISDRDALEIINFVLEIIESRK